MSQKLLLNNGIEFVDKYMVYRKFNVRQRVGASNEENYVPNRKGAYTHNNFRNGEYF